MLPTYVYDKFDRKYEVWGWGSNAFTNCDGLTSVELGAKTHEDDEFFNISVSNSNYSAIV